MSTDDYLLTAEPLDLVTLANLSPDLFFKKLRALPFEDQCSTIIDMLNHDWEYQDKQEETLFFPEYLQRFIEENRKEIHSAARTKP